jgi:hypothetical protein
VVLCFRMRIHVTGQGLGSDGRRLIGGKSDGPAEKRQNQNQKSYQLHRASCKHRGEAPRKPDNSVGSGGKLPDREIFHKRFLRIFRRGFLSIEAEGFSNLYYNCNKWLKAAGDQFRTTIATPNWNSTVRVVRGLLGVHSAGAQRGFAARVTPLCRSRDFGCGGFPGGGRWFRRVR